MNDNEKKIRTVIENRESLVMNGVINVECFNEDYLILNTSLGELTVEGENLKIESLTKENGDVYIIGKINGVFYKEKSSEKRFWGKLFK